MIIICSVEIKGGKERNGSGERQEKGWEERKEEGEFRGELKREIKKREERGRRER